MGLIAATTVMPPVLSQPVTVQAATKNNGWVTVNGNKYYYKNGKKVTGLQCINGTWYYFYSSGAWAKTFKGLAYNAGNWFYVQNGKINWNYTGLVQRQGVWYYVENGQVNFNRITLCYHNGSWYYVEYGTINWGYTGPITYKGTTYMVYKGVVNFGYTGIFIPWHHSSTSKIFGRPTGLDYYVRGIQQNTSGLVNADGYWWLLSKGRVRSSFTGLHYQNNTWWFIENGKVNFNKKTLANNGKGQYYYVVNGKVNFNYTGLVYCTPAGGTINRKGHYYVKNGLWQSNVNGKVKINGKTYNLKLGIVQ